MNNTKEKTYFGFCSQLSIEDGNGSSYYFKEGTDEKVVVTLVSETMEWAKENYKWKDTVCVGKVKGWAGVHTEKSNNRQLKSFEQQTRFYPDREYRFHY